MSLDSKAALPAVPDAASRGRFRLLLLALLVVVAGVLCFLFLARKPFWFDECDSVEIARLNWYNFARILWRREANMSLYYLLLRGWLHFGGSEFFIRSLSILPALATIPAIYWLGRRLFDRRVGLIAAALLTFNAYHVRYAQEARSYSLFIFLATLSSGFFVGNLRRPSRRNQVGYILASSLAVYAHFYAVLLVAAQWLALRTLKSEPTPPNVTRNWRWIAALSFPVLLFVGTTGAGPLSWIQRPGLHEIYDYYLHMAGNGGWVLLLLYGLACAGALLPVGRALLSRRLDWEPWRLQFLLVWLIFPVFFTVMVSFARPLFLARYLIFCLPALVILAAAGLARLSKIWLLTPALFLVLLLSLQGTFAYYDHDFDLNRDDWRAASYYVLDHARPGDVILFHIAMGRMPFEFYKTVYRKDGLGDAAKESLLTYGPQVIFPTHGDHLDYRDFMGKPSVEFLRSVPLHYDRVWVVLKNAGTPTNPDPTTTALGQIFSASYAHVQSLQFPWVEVRLYSRP